MAQVELVENGSVLKVTRDSLELVGSVPVGRVYVERMEPLGKGVIEDRRAMASGGLVTISIAMKDGRLKSSPRVLTRGVVGAEIRSRVEQKVANHIRDKLKGRRFTRHELAEEIAIEAARRFLIHNHRKRPLIAAAVVEAS